MLYVLFNIKRRLIFVRPIYYSQQLLIGVYAVGQLVQLINYNYMTELEKMHAFQN